MRYIVVFIFILYGCTIYAQKTKAKEIEHSIFDFYQEQIRRMAKTRGMSDVEFDKYLVKNQSKITSINDFVRLSETLFPYQEKTGILLFFFNKDILTRVFLEPGRLIELKHIHITKKAVEQLNKEVCRSTGIYQLSKARSPVQRGVSLITDDTKIAGTNTVSFEKIIANATKLLLPDHFSPKYRHLIIVPALSIGTFPFHLLKPYKDSLCLIDRCGFTISSGLIDLIAAKKRAGESQGYDYQRQVQFTFGSPVFICNPDYPTNTEFIFPDLPGAKKEIDSILPSC